jgi:Zn-dependent peptidase ImmA (M78 family)
LGLRDAWKLGWDPIENLTELFEDRNVRVGVFEAEPRFDACTFVAEVDGKALPVIASRQGVSGDRQRFSLVHELGHLMIRASGGLKSEAAMNRFAGAFLVSEPAARFELGESAEASTSTSSTC